MHASYLQHRDLKAFNNSLYLKVINKCILHWNGTFLSSNVWLLNKRSIFGSIT